MLPHPAPHIGVADEVDGPPEHLLLPASVRRKRERAGERLDVVPVPVGDLERAGQRIRRLRTGRGVLRAELEVVVGLRVVVPQPDQARDDLVAEAAGWLEARVFHFPLKRSCDRAEAERLDDCGIQRGDRHRGIGIDDDLRLSGESRDGRVELLPGYVLPRAEVRHARAHEAVRHNHLDLRLRPARRERRLRREERGEHGDGCEETPAHGAPIVGARRAL